MSAPASTRLDLALVRRGLVPARARARAEIEAGNVWCDGHRITRPATRVAEGARLELRGRAVPYVSRAGVKLDHALECFAIDVTSRTALDVGASTGGFTQVLLQRGAARVFAVDVGHGQLHRSLQGDPRVISLEGTDARLLTRHLVPDRVDFLTCDASFISLKKVLPPALNLTAEGAWLVALIKPQFEAGRSALGKRGVVKSPEMHARVCRDIEEWLAARPGWAVRGLTESPIPGGNGNREFIIAARRRG